MIHKCDKCGKISTGRYLRKHECNEHEVITSIKRSKKRKKTAYEKGMNCMLHADQNRGL
jgi:hypothetical protein